MGILSDIGGIGGIAKIAGKVFDDIHTSAEERASIARQDRQLDLEERKLDLERRRLDATGDSQQVKVNIEEAKHPSVFVAGWRPAVGWVCVIALLWHFVLHDMVAWAMAIWYPDLSPPPQGSIYEIIALVGGMLGLSKMRSSEKAKGISRDKIIAGRTVIQKLKKWKAD